MLFTLHQGKFIYAEQLTRSSFTCGLIAFIAKSKISFAVWGSVKQSNSEYFTTDIQQAEWRLRYFYQSLVWRSDIEKPYILHFRRQTIFPEILLNLKRNCTRILADFSENPCFNRLLRITHPHTNCIPDSMWLSQLPNKWSENSISNIYI